jgi:hypothetical protein
MAQTPLHDWWGAVRKAAWIAKESPLDVFNRSTSQAAVENATCISISSRASIPYVCLSAMAEKKRKICEQDLAADDFVIVRVDAACAGE